MSALVNQLKKEHKEILETLHNITNAGIGTAEGRRQLMSVKEKLLMHVAKEDSALYPVLRKEAIVNPQLKRTLDMFAKDMDLISAAAMGFFNKYTEENSGIEFAKDFGRLFVTLTSRINKEESILFTQYDGLEKRGKQP